MNALKARTSSLLGKYADRPAMRAVAIAALGIAAIRHPELAPLAVGAQASDTYVVQRYEISRTKNALTLIEEMDRQGFDLTLDEVNSEPFAHVFARIVESVLRERHVEKIRDFARMACNYRGIVWGDNTDAFDEMHRTFDGLSVREWQALLLLSGHEHEQRRPPDMEPQQWCRDFWPRYLKEVEGKGVRQDEMAGFLVQLTRTGLFIHCEVFADDQGVIMGHTTPYFDRLRVMIASTVRP